LVNFALLLILIRRKLGRLEGGQLGRTVLRICAATVPMALVTWIVSAGFSGDVAAGLMIRLLNVTLSIGAAAVVFYWCCRLFGVSELDEAVNGIGGRFLRLTRR
jgi:peptidoglycan biosynthesis protein MviN/MurJ (putative lipid II flippase)